MNKFFFVSPSTRGISLALTRHLLCTTQLPVFATYRRGTKEEISKRILGSGHLKAVDPARLNLLHLDLVNEQSIERAAGELHGIVGSTASLETAFFTGGILHLEKNSADLKLDKIMESFQINVISHLLLIKHFSNFLPSRQSDSEEVAKWVHISARVGSISDNSRGGWYSYRASKAALNQVIKTFDLQLQMKKSPAISVGIHPGTTRTDMSKDFWDSSSVSKLFEPEEAAQNIFEVVQKLDKTKRGRVWDWKGKEVLP